MQGMNVREDIWGRFSHGSQQHVRAEAVTLQVGPLIWLLEQQQPWEVSGSSDTIIWCFKSILLAAVWGQF